MSGKYRTIVADPPWHYDGFAMRVDHPHSSVSPTGGRVAVKPLPYSSMTVQQIADLPVADLTMPDARLFLWTTNRYLPEALSVVLSCWDFSYRQLLVWDKRPNVNPLGGSVAPNSAEYLIVAQRGSPKRTARWTSSIVQARKMRNVHSEKPDVFLDLVEQVSPGPYLELFARRARFGWDYWGDESLGTAEVAA